jgi:hypothetical protein
MHTPIISVLALALPAMAGPGETATYEMIWNASWSADTHPGAYPGNGHFTPISGTAHDASAVFWEAGGLASPGIEEMAEKGKTTPLDLEIQAQIDAGHALQFLKFQGTVAEDMPTVKVYEITVTEEFPLLTLTSMVAPSPDWFIGLNSLDFAPDGEWVERITVDLYAWDAGTDSGTNFGSPNEDTDPQEPISTLAGVFPFFDLPPISTLTFNLVSITGPCADCNADGNVDVLDFVCFQSEWQAQTVAGDCNGDGAYNILDFVCFQGRYVGGCE